MAKNDTAINVQAIIEFNRSILKNTNLQILDIFRDRSEHFAVALRKELERLYINFKRDLLSAIGTEGPTSIVSQGGAPFWFKLSQSHSDKKAKQGGNLPDFFLFKGRLRRYFKRFSVKKTLGPPSVFNKDTTVRNPDIVVDSQGKLRVKKGKSIGNQRTGQFVKDIRDLVFITKPTVFPRVKGRTVGNDLGKNLSINRLFPNQIGYRLWNRKRPFRPLVGPIINVYKTVKLKEAIKRAKQNG